METKKALITPQVHIQERKRLISPEEFTPMSPFQTCTYKLVSLSSQMYTELTEVQFVICTKFSKLVIAQMNF